jgi:L-methionine (R)-S-oxide reductase
VSFSTVSTQLQETGPLSLHHQLQQNLRALVEGETDPIADMANAAALLFWNLPAVNWAGFYFLKDDELVLGPFQGKAACIRIKLGQGVCGTAAARRQSVVVPNVHEFPGHIACDTASNSEIVVPILKDGNLIAVLDIDSPVFDRFSETDARELEKFAGILSDAIA